MASNLQWAAPKPLSFEGNLAENYRRFREHWDLFEKTELVERSQEVKCSYFLLCIGEEGREIYKTLSFTAAETTTDEEGTTTWTRTVAEIKEAFKQYCEPRRNVTFERHKFNTRNQHEGEHIDQYVSALKTLAKTCEFKDLESGLIRDRIVCGIRDQSVRVRLLREADLTLEKTVDICRATEHSKAQAKSLQSDGTAETVEVIKDGRRKANITRREKARRQQSSEQTNCGNCGRQHEPRACPAYGKRCNHCGKPNHFSTVCRSKQAQPTNIKDIEYSGEDSDSDFGIDGLSVDSMNESGSEEHVWLSINNKRMQLKLDTGAEANVLTKKDFDKAVPKKQRASKMRETKAKLTAYGGHDIPTLGKCFLTCHFKGERHVIEFQVVEGPKSVLGCRDCKKMNIVTFNNLDSLETSEAAQAPSVSIRGLTNDEIFQKYETCFEGLGEISAPYHIKLNPSVTPVISPPRKIPATLRDRVRDSLENMVELGVIKRVQEPTQWVNAMVVSEKRSGELRICIDPRELNKAIYREHYQLPTQQEITSRLAGAKFFSKRDAKSGYWQIPLDEESSFLTTFNTPFGRYRFTVIPFGVVFAQEVFHRTVSEAFGDIAGCETDIDDILVWGTTQEEHDDRLAEVLERVKSLNMTLNRAKCEFRKKTVTYLGELLTEQGVQPDPSKLKAIQEYTRPTCKQDVMRLLGMINYIAKFTPRISETTAPLRELIRKEVEFHWLEHHEQAFEKLKSQLTDPETLSYYDVAKPVTLQVDASKSGLGAALLQEERPVAYASKAMNATQERYAQIEKELLAIVFGCKRFHQYIYGKQVNVDSDHKPLEAIFNKPLSQAPSRLQKMLLQLQEYDIVLRYKKGSEMHLADALSRAHPCEHEVEEFESDIEAEKYVHLMSTEGYVTDRKLLDIKREIESDETMQQLTLMIQQGWPSSRKDVPSSLRVYFPLRDELSVEDGLIFKLNNILIPPKLRSDTLQKLHASHQGIEKTTHLARQCIFWPGMTAQIRDTVSTCSVCLTHRNSNASEPLKPHPLPSRPWERVATDLATYKGRPHLIVVDYYSRYPEVAELKNQTSKVVINKTKSFFSRHGIPEEVVSDNGPEYASAEYANFATKYGFRHTTTSPRYPQAGGLHERTVQTVKNLLLKAEESNEDPYLSLLEYRNTPIDGVTPAEALMGRKLRGTLPIRPKLLTPQNIDHSQFLVRRKAQQEYQKKNFDKKTKPLTDLQVGDSVRFKLNPEATWKPAVVISKHQMPRSYILQAEGGAEYRRNRKHILKTKETLVNADFPEDMDTSSTPGQETPQTNTSTSEELLSQTEPVGSLAPPRVSRYGRVIKPNPKYSSD